MHLVTPENSRWELSTGIFSKEISFDKKELKTVRKLTTYFQKLENTPLKIEIVLTTSIKHGFLQCHLPSGLHKNIFNL